MRKKYVYGFIINVILGIMLGVITEFALIYNIKWLIRITQNEIFWILVAIFVSIFSKGYASTLVNTTTNLIFMTISYYTVRLIKSGYTNIGGIYWYGIQSICVGLYFGTMIYLIKEKIINKKVTNYIPKLNIIFMTLSVILGIGIAWYCLSKSIFFIQPVYLVGILSILGFVIGTILGILQNKKIEKL